MRALEFQSYNIICSTTSIMDYSPPSEGWLMHFAMYAFSNHVQVLHNVTPIDLLVQSAVLFSLTGWLCRGAVEKVSTNRRAVHSPPSEGQILFQQRHISKQYREKLLH